MEIIDLHPDDGDTIGRVVILLTTEFREHCPRAWPDRDTALAEVRDSFGRDRFSRVAVDGGDVLGWVGGIRQYDGNVWELHPLVVRRDCQGRGIGRSLVANLEEYARSRGALTLWVGTDDERGLTSIAGVDLYPNCWEHLATIRNPHRHPYEFYLKCGFAIVGVMPDANGPGKPDIFMAKSVRNSVINRPS